MKRKRENYIPDNARKIAMKDGGAVFYLYENSKNQPCALCFVGRAQKPTWHHRFLNDKNRETKIATQIEATQKRIEDREARRAQRNKPHGWEKGLILYTSWGYDQTNTEFYEVIDIPSPCYVTLQQISAPMPAGETGFMTGHRVPDPKRKIGQPFRRKVDMSIREGCVTIDSVATAWVWDGKEKQVSWYA